MKYLLAVLACVFVVGCAGMTKGTRTIVERIPDVGSPWWVNDTKEYFEKDGNYYFRGMSADNPGLESSQKFASQNALSGIVRKIKQKVSYSEAGGLQTGDADSKYLLSIFAAVVESLDINGAAVKESYSERLSDGDNVTYRSYSLAELSKKDYEFAQKLVNDKARGEINKESNREVKEKVLQKLQKLEQSGN